MSIPAYPLQWPEGFPRTKSRDTGKFKTTLAGALKNVETSLVAFGRDSGNAVTHIALSSNVTLGAQRPVDPGVAIWFLWDGAQRCIAVDRYSSVEANLQAVHHVLEARRTEIRHGTLALVRATMKGFALALPAPGTKRWHEVLQVEPTATLGTGPRGFTEAGEFGGEGIALFHQVQTADILRVVAIGRWLGVIGKAASDSHFAGRVVR